MLLSNKKTKKTKKTKRIHSIVCYKKGASKGWVLASECTILKHAGTKKEIQKIAVEWLKKHPYIESKK